MLWLLEELGLPYEIKQYQRRADKMAPKDLTAIHPLGKAPTVTLEEPGKPLMTLTEV